MTKYEENNLDNGLNLRTIEQILFDFISLLDEVIATYKVLGKINDKDPRPNQLLFCHIINGFDSFISSLLFTTILSDNKKLKIYFQKNKNLDQKPTFKEIINIQEIGIVQWMKMEAVTILEQDLKRKRHSQKIELLLSAIAIDYKNIYVHLTGPGKHSTGCLRKKPTPENKKGMNHKTTSEKLIGYADILYEKRNSITHNRNHYLDKTVERLNQEWGLEINRSIVLIKQTTIKGVLRFYTSFCLELFKCTAIKNATQSTIELLKSNLEDLHEIKNIVNSANTDGDSRTIAGGIEGRKKTLIESGKKEFNQTKYKKITGASPTTSSRDIKKLLKEKFLIRKKRGVYSINSKK